MPLEVMHAHQGLAEGKRQRICHRRADQQRAGKPGALCLGNGVDVGPLGVGLPEYLFQQRDHAANMIARGQLGHDAAVFAVHGDLRMERMRTQANRRVVQRDTSFVTGRFNAEDQHGRRA